MIFSAEDSAKGVDGVRTRHAADTQVPRQEERLAVDKQRLIAFWLLTGLIFMIYFQYQARMQRTAQQAAQLAQQADREQADREQAEGEAGDEGGPPVDGSGAPDGNGNTAADATAEIDRLNWADDQPADAEPDDSEPAVPQPQNVEYAVLGSLGRDSVVVYLTNRGASVARIELSDPQYGDVEERYGYLGFLGLDYAASGCIVHTVAPGSPAATAKSHDPQIADGLTPGDRILRCQEQDVPQPIDLDRCLAKTRPRQDVELVVEREIDGARCASWHSRPRSPNTPWRSFSPLEAMINRLGKTGHRHSS